MPSDRVINKVTRIQSVLLSVLLACGLHSQAGCPPEVSPGESRRTCSKSINSNWEKVFLLSSNKRQVLGYLGLVQVICPSCNSNPWGPWSDWIGLDSAFIPRGGRWGKLDENCVYRWEKISPHSLPPKRKKRERELLSDAHVTLSKPKWPSSKLQSKAVFSAYAHHLLP